jgi:MscS family membrane protein
MQRLVLLVLVLLITVPQAARAADGKACVAPHGAVASVFGQLTPETATWPPCLAQGSRTDAQLRDSVLRIRSVYGAKGLHVDVNAASTDPGYLDQNKEHRFVPHPALADVVVERTKGGQWLFTSESLDRVDALYDTTFRGLDRRFVGRIPKPLQGEVFGIRLWQYIALFVVLLVGLVIRKVIQLIVKNRVRDLVEKLGQRWATRLVEVFASPGATLAMALLLRLSYPVLGLPVDAVLVLQVAVRLMVAVSVVWASYRLVDVAADRMAERAANTDSKLDDQLVPLVRKTLKLFVVIAGVLFVLQNLNVNVGALLAGLGIGGVAVALAAKDTIANFFGSIMIFADRPFQIGDAVTVGDVEGVVEEVGFRSTRIRTFSNSLVTVPNAKFMEANIDNRGRRIYRRTNTTLNLTYDTTPEQMQAFVEGIRAIIAANPYTRKDLYEVHMSGFGAHSLDVMLYFFLRTDTWSEELQQRHNVYLEIMRLAGELKVEFAFPTQTVHVASTAAPGVERLVPQSPAEARLAEVVEAFGPDGTRSRPAGPRITDSRYLPGSAPAGSAPAAPAQPSAKAS